MRLAERVAETIVHAAAHPRREVAVSGGAAVGFALGQRFNSALTDLVLSLVGKQCADHRWPRRRQRHLGRPPPGPGRFRGEHVSHLVRRSPATAVAERFLRPGEVLLALQTWAAGKARYAG